MFKVKRNLLYYANKEYKMPYNIDKYRKFPDYIFAYGKYFIFILSRRTENYSIFKINSWVANIKYYNQEVQFITLRGYLYSISNINCLPNNDIQPKLIKKFKFSLTCAIFYKNRLYSGSWDGKLRINKKEIQIHDGTIYDIKVRKNIIATCSTDRSICIIKHRNILYRVYDYRNRIYKCGFVENKIFIRRIHDLNKIKSWSFSYERKKHPIYYYSITECGKIRFYMNDQIIYEYDTKEFGIENIYIICDCFYIYFRNGSVRSHSIPSFQMLGQAELFIIDKNEAIIYYDKKIMGATIKCKVIQKCEDTLFCAHTNKLYKINNNEAVIVNSFESAIIKIEHDAIICIDRIYFTKNEHKEIKKVYLVRNITSHYRKYFGTRKGDLIFKNLRIKISQDAITGIKTIENKIFLSSRDGFIYVLDKLEIEELAKINRVNDSEPKNKIYEWGQLIKVNINYLGKKYITNDFLEGIVDYNESFFTFSLSENKVHIHTLTNTTSIEIGFKPKRYFIDEKTFYFIKENKLYSVNLKLEKLCHNQDYMHFIETSHGNFYCTNTFIEYKIYTKTIDKLICPGISTTKNHLDLLFIGTLTGIFKVLKIEKNIVFEVYSRDFSGRIMDLIYYNGIILLDSFGNIHFSDIHYNFYKTINFGILMTTINIFNDKIYLGTGNGVIYILNDFNLNILHSKHDCSINKIININDKIASIGDDHRLIIDDIIINEHSGPIVDIINCPDDKIFFTLSIDKFVRVFNYDYEVIQKLKTCIYNPKKLCFDDNSLMVIGSGVEKLNFNKLN